MVVPLLLAARFAFGWKIGDSESGLCYFNFESMRVERGNALAGSFDMHGDLVVEGSVSGEVVVRGDLRIEKDGRVEGNLSCMSAALKGSFSGMLQCEAGATIFPGAQVEGKVMAREVVFESAAQPAAPLEERASEAERWEMDDRKVPLVTGRSGRLIVRQTSILKSKEPG